MSSAYEYRLTVTYGETNALGNVYYVNHLAWQGKVRELFLLDHAPGFLKRIGPEFTIVTKSAHCEYDEELRAFDRIIIRMRLGRRNDNTLRMLFDYVRVDANGQETRVARGAQEIVCLDARAESPKPFPAELIKVLERYAS